MISRRLVLLGIGATVLTGCGFRLRGTGPQIGELPPKLRIVTADPFSPLIRKIIRQLEDQGTEIVDRDTSVPTLTLILPRSEERVLGPISALNGVAREQVELSLTMTYKMDAPNMTQLIPETPVKASLIYVDSGADTSAEDSRVAQLRRGLETDLLGQVVSSIRVRYAQALKLSSPKAP